MSISAAAHARLQFDLPPSAQPEAHADVQLLHPSAYCCLLEAAQCGVRATLLLPVFESPARSSCAAVLEVVQVQGMQFDLLALALSAVLEVRGGAGLAGRDVVLFDANIAAGLSPLHAIALPSGPVPGALHRSAQSVLPAGELPVHLRREGGTSVRSGSDYAGACSTQLRAVLSNFCVYHACAQPAKLVRAAV